MSLGKNWCQWVWVSLTWRTWQHQTQRCSMMTRVSLRTQALYSYSAEEDTLGFSIKMSLPEFITKFNRTFSVINIFPCSLYYPTQYYIYMMRNMTRWNDWDRTQREDVSYLIVGGTHDWRFWLKFWVYYHLSSIFKSHYLTALL